MINVQFSLSLEKFFFFNSILKYHYKNYYRTTTERKTTKIPSEISDGNDDREIYQPRYVPSVEPMTEKSSTDKKICKPIVEIQYMKAKKDHILNLMRLDSEIHIIKFLVIPHKSIRTML